MTIRHPLFSGSAVMIIGSNLTNLIAYIYHFIVGRMLGPAIYSELSSILGVLTILFTGFTFLSTVVVKFVSSDDGGSIDMYRWFRKKIYNICIIVFVLLLVLSPSISTYIKVELKTVILIAPITVFGVLGILYRSFMQGRLQFTRLIIAMNLDIVSRLVVSVLGIYFGFKVFGAVFGLLFGTLVGVIYLNNFIGKIVEKGTSEKKINNLRKVLLYTVPVFVTSMSSNILLSADVIMVKHFLSAHDAGIYASLSTLGRVIFYAASPIGAVMFPLIIKNFSKGKSYIQYFYMSLLITLLLCLGASVSYLLFPKLAIGTLFGSKFLEGMPYLFWFGIFNSVFTLAQLFISFFLSIEKTKIIYVSLATALLQVGAINLFHSGILQVVKINTIVTSLLLVCLILYFLYEKKFKRI